MQGYVQVYTCLTSLPLAIPQYRVEGQTIGAPMSREVHYKYDATFISPTDSFTQFSSLYVFWTVSGWALRRSDVSLSIEIPQKSWSNSVTSSMADALLDCGGLRHTFSKWCCLPHIDQTWLYAGHDCMRTFRWLEWPLLPKYVQCCLSPGVVGLGFVRETLWDFLYELAAAEVVPWLLFKWRMERQPTSFASIILWHSRDRCPGLAHWICAPWCLGQRVRGPIRLWSRLSCSQRYLYIYYTSLGSCILWFDHADGQCSCVLACSGLAVSGENHAWQPLCFLFWPPDAVWIRVLTIVKYLVVLG